MEYVGCVSGYVEGQPGDEVAHGSVVQFYVSTAPTPTPEAEGNE